MDRICLSVAMLPIAREMGWSEGVQVGASCPSLYWEGFVAQHDAARHTAAQHTLLLTANGVHHQFCHVSDASAE